MGVDEKVIIDDFYETQKKIIFENKIGDNYCVLVNSKNPIVESTYTSFIYKNLDEFKSKVSNDIRKINSAHDIKFSIWVFD